MERPNTLAELYNSLLQSDEFAETSILINSIPETAQGNEYIDQFLGARSKFPTSTVVPFKQARIMIHWASKVGAQVELADETND